MWRLPTVTIRCSPISVHSAPMQVIAGLTALPRSASATTRNQLPKQCSSILLLYSGAMLSATRRCATSVSIFTQPNFPLFRNIGLTSTTATLTPPSLQLWHRAYSAMPMMMKTSGEAASQAPTAFRFIPSMQDHSILWRMRNMAKSSGAQCRKRQRFSRMIPTPISGMTHGSDSWR